MSRIRLIDESREETGLVSGVVGSTDLTRLSDKAWRGLEQDPFEPVAADCFVLEVQTWFTHLHKRTIHSGLATLLVAGVCTAQSAQSEGSGSTFEQTSVAANQRNGQAAPNASPLPAGTTFEAELIEPVDARKNQPGAAR